MQAVFILGPDIFQAALDRRPGDFIHQVLNVRVQGIGQFVDFNRGLFGLILDQTDIFFNCRLLFVGKFIEILRCERLAVNYWDRFKFLIGFGFNDAYRRSCF
jgi:hypothetical protein